MAYAIQDIEGIGPAFAERLATAEIDTAETLLERCGSAKGRKEVAAKTGLSEAQLLKWANMADLMRVSGIGGEFAELLEAAGVDTVSELKQRNAGMLTARLREVNEQKKLTRALLAEKTVQGWITQAGTLDPRVSH